MYGFEIDIYAIEKGEEGEVLEKDIFSSYDSNAVYESQQEAESHIKREFDEMMLEAEALTTCELDHEILVYYHNPETNRYQYEKYEVEEEEN